MAAFRRSPLVTAVVAFVVLDLGILVLNYAIAARIASDAVAINLAGRQRMLSQRTTKAVLLATDATRPEGQRAAAAAEATQAWLTFGATLSAFAQGGFVVGGDGRRAHLEAVTGNAELLVGKIIGITREWPAVPAEEPRLRQFAGFMVDRNGEILDGMNQLTSALERQSVALTGRLRLAQTIAFALSLLNFAAILRMMHRAQRRAEQNARTDALTGIANRAGLFGALEPLLAQGAAVGVLLLDLDHFKSVNDTYGHAAGDATLREVARRLRTWQRPGWSCGRIGGDEFVVVCPGVDPDTLAAAAADLQQLLAGVPAGHGMVSASVGWALSQGGGSADALLMAADARMYGSKSGSRQGDGRISGNYRRVAAAVPSGLAAQEPPGF